MGDIKLPPGEPLLSGYSAEFVLAYAKQAAEMERERCIAFLMKLHEQDQGAHNYFKWAANKLSQSTTRSAVEIEREACIAVCMGMQNGWPSDDHIACAEAIKARGTK